MGRGSSNSGRAQQTMKIKKGNLTEERFVNAFIDVAIKKREAEIQRSDMPQRDGWRESISDRAREKAEREWKSLKDRNATIVSKVPDNYSMIYGYTSNDDVIMYREKVPRFGSGRRAATFVAVFSPELSKAINRRKK